MLIDLTNISRRINAPSPSLQLSRRSLTLFFFFKVPLSLREVVCLDVGGRPSFEIALFSFVGGLRSLCL